MRFSGPPFGGLVFEIMTRNNRGSTFQDVTGWEPLSGGYTIHCVGGAVS